MEKENIFKIIKSAFCGLIFLKDRDSSIEIITPFSTINNKFVSIFITEKQGKFIISDGGWISKDFYNQIIDENAEDILSRILEEYKTYYGIKSTGSLNAIHYYKTAETLDAIASDAFDLANFITAVVNSRFLRYRDENDQRERERFKRNADDFLAINYRDSVRFRTHLDDFKSIRYNAIIEKQNNLYLFSYITGSTNIYFENDLRRSIVNFEIADRSKFRANIKEKIALINNEAAGFAYGRTSELIDLLNERSTRKFIPWSEKEFVLQIIPN